MGLMQIIETVNHAMLLVKHALEPLTPVLFALMDYYSKIIISVLQIVAMDNLWMPIKWFARYVALIAPHV
jgi:hypothetical protein